ncbi:MAG: NUDIX domain-containing protein [bacterium]
MKPKSHPADRHHVRLIVSVFAEKNGRFLFIEEHKRGRRFAEPVGHVEPRESILKAAQREFREETGYSVTLRSLIGVYHNIYSRPSVSDSLRYIFLGTIGAMMSRSEANIQLRWIERKNLRTIVGRLTHPTSRQALKDLLIGKRWPLSVIREMRLERNPILR